MFPAVKDLIQTLYLDHPLIKHHKTDDVAMNIVTSVKPYIWSEKQYEGGTYDGGYFHTKKNVSHFVNEAMHVDNEDVHSDHDQMHRSGLSEKRARKIPDIIGWMGKLVQM